MPKKPKPTHKIYCLECKAETVGRKEFRSAFHIKGVDKASYTRRATAQQTRWIVVCTECGATYAGLPPKTSDTKRAAAAERGGQLRLF